MTATFPIACWTRLREKILKGCEAEAYSSPIDFRHGFVELARVQCYGAIINQNVSSGMAARGDELISRPLS